MTDQQTEKPSEERFLEMVNDVVAQRDHGIPTAAKRGRDPRWPYAPVIDHGIQSVGVHRTRTEQVLGCAYATREEAIAQARKAIQARRDDFRAKLLAPNMRAIREQWNLPRNVPGWTDAGQNPGHRRLNSDPQTAPCVNHPNERAVTNLDGEHLCLSCANAWVRAEGAAQAQAERDEADFEKRP